MKKTPKKLVLRSETLRALVDMDLARAVGGFGSGAVPCPLVDSGKINCDTDVAVTATTACPPQ